MSYLRVIPRDLFNEASLLKCYGQLYLNLEKMGLQDRLAHEGDGEYFQVRQSQDSGALTIDNVTLWIGGEVNGNSFVDAMPCRLWRPLNSRAPYPLWLSYDDAEVAVFNDDGSFTEDMVAFLQADHSF